MTVRVVDRLEMIEIQKDQREFVPVTLRAIDLRLKDEIEMARIVQSGAVVGNREFVNPLNVTRVFKRNCRKVRQSFQQRQVTIRKAVHIHAVDQLDHAETMVTET